MDKILQKVTKDKDPRRVDPGRMDRENVMKTTKENILIDAKKGGVDTINSSNETMGPTTNSSNETTSATNNARNETTSVINTTTTRSNNTYVYSVGLIAVLAIGACIFFAYNTFQPKKIRQ